MPLVGQIKIEIQCDFDETQEIFSIVPIENSPNESHKENIDENPPSPKSDLEIHLCGICRKKFPCKIMLKNHVLSHSYKSCIDKKFVCDKCSERFDDTEKLTSHLLTHSGDLGNWCDVCNKKFISAHGLKSHITHKHTTTHQKQLAEGISTTPATHKKQLLLEGTSTAAESSIKSGKFSCKYCDKQFGSVTGLRNHTASHSDQRPFKCSQCDLDYKDYSSLSRHMLKHSESSIKSGKFSCKHCDKQFASFPSLRAHTASHSGLNTNKKLNNKSSKNPLQLSKKNFSKHRLQENSAKSDNLTKSVKRKHNNISKQDEKKKTINDGKMSKFPIYYCTFCTMKFDHALKFKNHMLLHTDCNPFICPFCNSDFPSASNLKLHALTVHGYTCNNAAQLLNTNPVHDAQNVIPPSTDV